MNFTFPSLFPKLFLERVSLATICSLIFAAFLSFLLLIAFSGPLVSIEERVGGMTWTLSPDSAIEERVTLVSIDERSLSRIGPWPWSREVMANLVNSINETGAQLQIHDVVYPEGDKPGDVLFAAALADDERAIVAQLPVLQTQNELLQSGVLSHPVSGISCSPGQLNNSMPQAVNYIGASETLVNIPKGHIAPVIDRDGSIRKAPAVICVADQPYPALSLAPFFHITNSSEWEPELLRKVAFLSQARRFS